MARKTLILGIGASAAAVARRALADGEEVTIYAGPSTEGNVSAARPFETAGASVRFDTEDVKGSYDLCVASPGIPKTGAFYQSALRASDELVCEPEYAWRRGPENWVAVTGTNGKTTTTTLVAHLLRQAGERVWLCGNTQAQTTTDAVEERAAQGEGGWIVAELSSFQLASTKRFSPAVAVLLNISSDHLSWHGSQEAYAADKLKIFENLGAGQTAVLCDAVPEADALGAGLAASGARVVRVGADHGSDCAWEGDGVLLCRDARGALTSLLPAGELQIKGSHNVVNALAAAAVALDLGVDAPHVRVGLASFEPLEHRIEPVGEVAGVAFYDDSKATNVDSTVKALTAFPDRKVVLLLGGRDKGTDLSALVAAAEGACSAVVCYGEAAGRFRAAFEGSPVPCESAHGMAEAFSRACSVAEPGEVVLLSPACASFDEFSGFSERGDVFKRLVRGLRGGAA